MSVFARVCKIRLPLITLKMISRHFQSNRTAEVSRHLFGTSDHMTTGFTIWPRLLLWWHWVEFCPVSINMRTRERATCEQKMGAIWGNGFKYFPFKSSWQSSEKESKHYCLLLAASEVYPGNIWGEVREVREMKRREDALDGAEY